MAEISTIARPYAVAAFKLGKETKSLAKWSEMLKFASAVSTDEKMLAFILNPKVLANELQDAFLNVCGKNLNEQGQNLIKVLVEYGRMSLLPAISSAFE
jgi:F-type H+-transporting ATPase subunit delta